MLTKKTRFLKLLGEVEALYAPVYNASYGLSTNLIKKLFQYSDLGKPLNLGIIVLEETDEENCYTVVEGIQKFITLSLVMYSLCECYKQTSATNEQAITKLYEKYLLNGNGLKLQLNNSDQVSLEKIIYREKLSNEEKENNLFKVLHAFWEEIKEQGYSANDLYQLMKTIECYIIKVGKGDGLEMYHTLNKNSLYLDNITLIRSYLEENEKACILAFDEIIEEFVAYRHGDKLEQFFQDFLSIQQTKTNIPRQEIYPFFVAYLESLSKQVSPERVMRKVRDYALTYLKLLTVNFEYFDIKKNMARINELDGQRAYPYLMEVMMDYEAGRITTDTLNLTLKAVYDFLRTNENFDFASLSQQINQKLAGKKML